MLATALRLFHRVPVADARQIFEGNPAPRVWGFRHQLVGHAVVFIRGKALLLATTFLEQSLGRFGAFGLQRWRNFA